MELLFLCLGNCRTALKEKMECIHRFPFPDHEEKL